MGEVFIGSEAIAKGQVTRHELQRWYRAIYRDVYVSKRHDPVSLHDRATAAWLWSRRQAVIAGLTASALHGAVWIDDDAPVELIWHSSRPQRGMIVRNERIDDDEIAVMSGLPVTTKSRTTFDIGRSLPTREAVAHLDALVRTGGFSARDVLALAARYKGARGIRRLKAALPLVDPGAQSPRESWLRLLLIDAGLPKPMTQIPVFDGYRVVAYLDMGWEGIKVAVEYDGDQHRTDRGQYVKDIRRLAMLERMGWIVVRVIAEDRPEAIVGRVHEALRRRGVNEFDVMRGSTRSFAA